jgi:CHAT domain-containing protein/tetratricopeptide (TPR) repeat protein
MKIEPRNDVIGRSKSGLRTAFAALCLVGICSIASESAPTPVQSIRSFIERGKYADAERAARARLNDLEHSKGTDSLQVASTLDLLVETLRRGGRGGRPEAREACDRALQIKASLIGKSSPEYAASLYQLGFLLYVNGDYNQARPSLEQALRIRETTLGRDHRDVAESLIPLAGLESDHGDNALAESLFTRALDIRTREFGPESPEVGECLTALATLHFRTGDFAEAAQTYEQALPVLERSLGPTHPKVATCLNNLGALLGEMGDYATSLACYRRALKIRIGALGRDHELVATTLANIGKELAATGKVADAAISYRGALAIQESRFGSGSPEVGRNLTRLGLLDLQVGSQERARKSLSRAVSILEISGEEDPDLADALAGLATVEAAEGDSTLARSMYERAIRIREASLGQMHPDVALLLTQYARVLAAGGDERLAIEYALRGEEISREHLRLTCRSLSERQALQYAASRSPGARVASAALVSMSKPPEDEVREVWDAIVRGRTLVLDEMASRSRTLAAGNDSTSKELLDRLGAARRRLANLSVAGPRGDSPVRYREQVGRARDEMEKLERTLASRSSSFRQEQKRDRIGLPEIASSMPDNSALVAYAAAGDSSRRSYVAFVLRPPAAPVAIPLGRAATIDGKVSRWLADLREEAADPNSDSGNIPSRSSGAALSRAVWDPVALYVKDAVRIFIVPEGSIHLVSFAALPVGRDGYLLERGIVFHYLSAERDLVPEDHAAKTGIGLLALGNPTYGGSAVDGVQASSSGPRSRGKPAQFSDSDCPDFESTVFPPLPNSGKEVLDIARLWGDHNRAITLVGDGATESAFKSRAPGRMALHVATHGFFLGECSPTGGGTRGIGATATSTTVKRNRKPNPDHPLLLAGLALSGANLRASTGLDQEDGILTAEEIAGLDLSGVQWAVLSACDTGNGRVMAGEGILGLQRAFQIAGARTVIMSLWAVEDEATRAWMVDLYEGRVSRKLDTATAVAQASLHVLRERRAQARSTSPFYWAGFVAVGDWK